MFRRHRVKQWWSLKLRKGKRGTVMCLAVLIRPMQTSQGKFYSDSGMKVMLSDVL